MRAFVGRTRELSGLKSQVEKLSSGKGFITLLAGAQGLGKSRLLERLTEYAGAEGITVAWGRAWEVGGAPAYYAWSQVLTELADWAGPELPELLGTFAPYAARLCPEIAARLPELESASELESSQTQFRMYDAMARFLRAVAQRSPILLCFDDLHAADRNSLLMLQFVARSLRAARVGIVGSYRPEVLPAIGADVAAELSRLGREGDTLSLGPLSRDEIANMLISTLSRSVPDGVITSVASASEGSPLFVGEFARLLEEQKQLQTVVAAGESLPIPAGIQEVLRARQAALEPSERVLLELSAVIGRDFELSLLALASETEPAPALSALDRAINLGLIERLGPTRFRFSHVLVRESLYQGLSLSQRTALHLKVANTLEQRGDDADSATLLFHHLRQAVPLVDSERLVLAGLRAARESMRLLAFEAAAHSLNQALSMLSQAGQPQTRAELLTLLAGAEARMGHPSEALSAAEQAVAIARAQGDSALFSRAALQLGAEFTPGFTNSRLVDLLQQALAILPEGDSELRAKVMARLAAAKQPSNSPRREVAAAHEAIAMARRLDDPAVLRNVIYMASSALASFEHPGVREPVDREMVRLAHGAGDAVQEARALLRLCDDTFELGRVSEAETMVQQYAEQARELGLPHYDWQASVLRAAFAVLHGDFDQANANLERAVAVGASDRNEGVEACMAWFRISMLSLQGRDVDPGDLQDEIRRCLGRSPLVDQFLNLCLGITHARAQNAAGARSALAGLPIGSWLEDENITMSWLAECVYAAGDRERAQRIWPQLIRYADCWVSGGIAMGFREGPVARPLGLLAACLGRPTEAVQYLERAARELRRFGAWPLLSRTNCELAEILVAAGEPSQARRVQELATEGAALADRYDLGQLRERAKRLAPGFAPKQPSRPDSDADYSASLSELAAGIAHEINNPLGALQAHADLARQAVAMIEQALHEPDDDATAKRNKLLRAVKTLSEMQSVAPEATQRIGRVVQQLKSFARVDQAEIDIVDLEESLDAALALLAHRSVGRIAVERDYCRASRVRCQAQPVNDALMSVLATAIDAIEGEGTLTVTTQASDTGVAVEIGDTGTGYPPEVLKRLFDPTLQRAGSRVGMSLRLPIARRVVEEHGGRISARSRPGGGAVFRLELPRNTA